MLEETVEPQVDVEQVAEVVEEQQEANVEEKDTQVPLAALQKERRKRQELEYELQLMRQGPQAPPKEDESMYEPVTKADLKRHSEDVIRSVEEKKWIKDNPDKAKQVNENLADFLKTKPHLADALKNAPNRYEEAWELMRALSPKEQRQLKAPQPVRKEAPGSPNGVPKGAAMDQAVDLMTMTDNEFVAWRNSQKKRR